METADKNLSPQESLHLIEAMIAKTKANISENTFYFLMWGWLAFVAILGQYFLKVVVDYRHHYIVWLISFAGIIASITYTHKRKRQVRARTYISESMSFLWTG